MNSKYHYLLVAVAALSLGGCSTDDTSTEPENGRYKISFTVAEDIETRTTLDKGDFLRWVPTDQVGIYTVGNNLNPNTFTVADVNQHPVEFIGTLKKSVSPGDKFYAYYPYDEEQSTDPAAVKLTIPAAQTQTQAGVYNGESHPLVALPMEFEWERESYACRMSSVRFRQLGAIVEMQLYSSDEALRSEKIQSVKFVSEKPVAGDFTFDLTSVTKEDTPQISGYELTEVTTTLDQPAAIPATKDEATRVYLTIAPGEYTGEFVVTTDAAQYTFHLAEPMTFGRAVIKGLPADLATATRKLPYAENDPIQFEDSTVKAICIENWDKNGDGELSYGEAAAVTSIGTKFQRKSIGSFDELQYFTGLKSIGSSAFEDCSSLTSINLPDGVTAIGAYAFSGCGLTSIYIPQEVSDIGNNVFQGCSSLSAFYGNCASDDHRCLIQGGELLAFAPADLTEYTIPDGVTSIGSSAFEGCSSLTSINIPDGVIGIGDSAFYGCSWLASINLPDGVMAIGAYAFYDCGLTSIDIPQKVSSIGERAFERCFSLAAFYGKYASADNHCLIQDGVLLAFAPAYLTEYTIPDGVTTIGSYAFYDCISLTNITIPDGVTAIGSYAFSNCNLTSINIPNGVTTIENSTFYNCDNLTSIFIPDGVIAIGDYAFADSRSLTSVTIPDGVTTIGERAFADCWNLMSVYCNPTTPPTIGSDAFSWAPSSMKIYVPTASVEAYKTAESWSKYTSKIFANNN